MADVRCDPTIFHLQVWCPTPRPWETTRVIDCKVEYKAKMAFTNGALLISEARGTLWTSLQLCCGVEGLSKPYDSSKVSEAPDELTIQIYVLFALFAGRYASSWEVSEQILLDWLAVSFHKVSWLAHQVLHLLKLFFMLKF